VLILAATPIGQVGDASPRLAEVLRSADVVAAEDTRRLRRLARDIGVEIGGTVVSYFEGNEQRRTPELIETLRGGGTVVVATDAGMPSVSDPGYRLVTAAIAAGIQVTAVPGPSAVLTALAVSGLPVDRRLAESATEQRTMVFFESPHRTVATLRAMAKAWGADRRAAVCRELTKTYEEVRRGTLAELVAWAATLEHGVRGEVTIVAGGADPVATDLAAADLAEMVAAREAGGDSTRDAISAVVAATGVRKREVYAAVHTGAPSD
jgi:16S rRNA (cytidine1402-2'-O)-methyltransferase